MPSPVTVSVQAPYSANEQQFLVLAVQAALGRFRSIHPHSLTTRSIFHLPVHQISLPRQDARLRHAQKPVH